MGALTVNVEGAVAFGALHPQWYIFPGSLEPDGEGGFIKRPLGKWTRDATLGSDEQGIREVWSRLVGDGTAVVCVACDPSGIWVLDDDRDIAPETGWPALLASLNTLVLRSSTKGRPHYVFKVGEDGQRPKEGRWIGGDVKSSGIIFISEYEPIKDLEPTEAPTELVEKLGASMVSSGSTGRIAASSEEMWEWISSFTEDDLVLGGEGPDRFLGVVVDQFRKAVDSGEHRRQACRSAVWAAAKEAASGFYTPIDAYLAIRGVYQEMRELSHGSKGWTADRERDYDLMWAGVVSAIISGDMDDAIAANLDAVGAVSDDEILDLLELWSAISDGDDNDENVDDEEEDPVKVMIEVGGQSGGGDEPPVRAWAAPGEDPDPIDPNYRWDCPEGVHPLASKPGERPVMAADSPVWDTIHGKLAKALSSGAAEVSDIAVLAASLVHAGTHLAGRATHYIGGDAHNSILWGALVGRSAAARKSMSLSMMQGVYFGFPGEPGVSSDPRLWEQWLPRKLSGFNSGEVLIDSFLAPTLVTGDDDEDADSAYYFNPRAVAVESELDRLWTVAGRDGSVLAVVLCNAWDGSTMSVRSRGSGVVEVVAGQYALGVLGAATETRAIAAVSRNDGQMVYSGLANRYLWFLLPDETMDLPMSDGSLPWGAIYDYRDALGLREVRSSEIPIWGDDIGLTADAKELWVSVYPWLKRGSKQANGALAREALSRAEAQVRRMALLFSLSRKGGEAAVNLHDMQCALSVWEYCRASIRFMLAPERAVEMGDRNDGSVQRSVWSLLEDFAHPGWGTVSEIAEAVKKDRGSINHIVKKMVADGLLVEGVSSSGRRGKPPRVIALTKRRDSGTLAHHSEGTRSGAGIDLSSVRWL